MMDKIKVPKFKLNIIPPDLKPALLYDSYTLENEEFSGFEAFKACEFFRRETNLITARIGKAKPVNAENIKTTRPGPGEFSFKIFNGDCEFSDFIDCFIQGLNTPPEAAHFTTLSVNPHTFEVLNRIDCEKWLLVSSYFLASDKAGVIPRLIKNGTIEANRYRIGYFRNHTKIVLLKSGPDHFVMTGSSNLRSAGSLEQLTIHNDPGVYEFCRNFIETVIRMKPISGYMEAGEDFSQERESIDDLFL